MHLALAIQQREEGMTKDGKVQRFHIEKLKIEIYSTREAAGAAAAQAVADALIQLANCRESVAVIFATGASQLDTLDALTRIEHLPWNQVRGFHMDEYVGIAEDHLASFRRYLRENLTQKVQMHEFFEIDGTAPDPEQACKDYAELLRSADPQLCLLGIGENGHLAFNDPAVADFNDPVDMKVAHLDTVCRRQQAAAGAAKDEFTLGIIVQRPLGGKLIHDRDSIDPAMALVDDICDWLLIDGASVRFFDTD